MKQSLLLLACISFCLAILVFDAHTPLGMAEWMLYLVPLAFTFWLMRRRQIVFVGSLCVLFLLIGFVLSAPLPGGIAWPLALFNRTVGAGVLLLITIVFAQRGKMEERIDYLNKMLRAIATVNQMLVKEKNRDKLLKNVCNLFVENKGYYNAWIALLDKDGKLASTFKAGIDETFNQLVEVMRRAEQPTCARIAFEKAGIHVIDEPATDCPDCPLSKLYLPRSVLITRLEYNSKVYGLLTVSVPKGMVLEDEKTLFKGIAEDISYALHSLEVEDEKTQLQKYLQLQVNRMPIALIVWDTEFRVRTWNPAATRIFGFSENEALGKHPYDFIVPKEAQPHVDEIWGRLLKGDETAHSVNENITKDGRTIICEWTNTPLKGDDGTVIGVLSMTQDITPRKKMEEELTRYTEHLEELVKERARELEESEKKFRGIADRSFDAILAMDLQGRFTYASPTVERIFGFKPEEVLGKNFQNFLPESEIPKIVQAFTEAVKGRTMEGLQLEILRKDGSRAFAEVNGSLICKDGKLVGIQGIMRDVTERKRTEEVLKESESKLSGMLSAMADLVFALDSEGRFTFYSAPPTEELYVPPERFLGKKYSEVLPPHVVELADKALEENKNGKVSSFDYTLEMNREIKWFSATLSPLSIDGEYSGSVVVARNITERKRMEDELRQHAEEIKALSESISQRLERKIKQIDNIALVRDRLRKAPDISTGLDLVLEMALSDLEMDVAAVLTIDRKENAVKVRGFKSRIAGFELNESYPLDGGFVELEALRENKTVSKPIGKGETSILGTASIHCVPILFGKEVHGLLILGSQMGMSLDSSDLAILGLHAELTSTLFTTQPLAITPTKEMIKRIERRYELGFGYSYLVANNVEKAFAVFADNVLSGLPGLCITREFPSKVREKYGLEKTPIVWLTEEKAEGQTTIHSLQDLSILIGIFLEKVGRGVVLLDGSEYLITTHGFETFLRFLQLNRSRFEQTDSILLLPLLEEALDKREVKLIERETKPLIAA